MKTRLEYFLILSALLLVPPLAYSEPGATLKHLSNTPVTMLDWGVEKMIKRLDGLQVTGVGKIRVTVTVDREKSRFVVYGHSFREGDTAQEAKQWCQLTVTAIRGALGVSASSGKSVMPTGTIIRTFFSHNSTNDSKASQNFYQDLENMTLITASYALTNSKQEVRCEAPLLGTDITYSK